MANGYIGKISAVVTANTSDLSRKLQGAVKDVDRFANTLNRSVAASAQQATSSLEKIFTPLQRLERKLQTALQLNLRTDDEVRKIQSLVSVADQINKPLERAAGSFSKLSLEVQGAFLPALNRAQDSVVLLNRRVNETGGVSSRAFGLVEQSVSRAASAIQRLGEAQRLVSSGPRADSLAFADPRAFQSLQASAAIRQQASQLPESALADGRVARQVGNLSAVDDRIARARARIESIQARPRVDATELAAARQELDRLLAAADRIRAGIQIRLDAQKAIADANALKQALDAIRSQQQFSATGRFQNIEQAKESLQEAIALQDKLTAGQRAAIQPATSAAIDAVESAGTTGNFDAAKDAIDQIRQSAQSGISLNLQSEAAQKAANDLAATIGRLKEDADFVITGRPQNLDQVQAELNKVISTLEKLDSTERSAQGVRVQAVIDLIGKGDIDGAIAALDDLKEKSGEAISIQVEAKQAQDRIDALAASWARALSGIPASAKEVDAEFQALAGRISRLDLGQRVGLEGLVQDFQASVAAGRPLIEQYEKLLALSAAVNNLDGRGTGPIGDVSRFGVDKLQLGFQQAAFAVDDFFSVTGDFQQRLRAVSNNVTQLGFILGSTEGLFLSLAAVVGAQAFIQLEKFANSNLDTADRVKALNDALSRQKSLVESLAEAYRSVADAIGSSGLSSETRDLRERNKLIDDLRKKQDDQQRDRITGLNRDVQRERGIQTARQRELEATADPGERVRLEREIRQSRERERLATDAAVSRPGATAAQAVEAAADARFRADAAAIEARARRAAGASGPGGQGQAAAEFQRQRELAAAEARRADFVAAGVGRVQGAGDARAQAAEANRIIDEAQQEIANSITTGFVGFFDGANQERRAQLARLEEERAQLEKDIFRAATNEVAIEATKTAIAASAEIGAALQLLTDALGSPAASAIGRQLEAITGSILAAERRIEEAQKTGDVAAAEAARAQVEAANAQKDALISAANSVVAFADTLDRISTQLANTVAQEARSAADQSRRDANAAQARADRLGNPLADADSDFARRQRQRLERDARRAEDRAAEVEAENARVRDDFERDARRGGLGAETQRLIRERDAIDAVLRGDIAASDEQRQEARRRRDEIDRQLDRQFEDSPAGREAAARADRADREQAARTQREEDIARGRELSRSPAEQAGRQLADDLRALQAARDEAIAGGGNRAKVQQDFADDRQRIIEDSFRSTAPAIFALADAVQNSILQGPSRAALQASDVSTVEGARELNRLLRGDDAARDQNLVELQKQSQSLDELVRIAREGGAVIAN